MTSIGAVITGQLRQDGTLVLDALPPLGAQVSLGPGTRASNCVILFVPRRHLHHAQVAIALARGEDLARHRVVEGLGQLQVAAARHEGGVLALHRRPERLVASRGPEHLRERLHHVPHHGGVEREPLHHVALHAELLQELNPLAR